MKKILFTVLLLSIAGLVKAQIENPVKWAAGAKKISNTEAIVMLKATIDDGWHIYSQKKADNGGPVSTRFTFAPSADYTVIGATAEPAPVTRFEESFSMNVSFYEHSVIFQQKIKLNKPATIVKGTIKFMVCNDEKCLPPDTVPFTAEIK